MSIEMKKIFKKIGLSWTSHFVFTFTHLTPGLMCSSIYFTDIQYRLKHSFNNEDFPTIKDILKLQLPPYCNTVNI